MFHVCILLLLDEYTISFQFSAWSKTTSWPDIGIDLHDTEIFYFEFKIWIVCKFWIVSIRMRGNIFWLCKLEWTKYLQKSIMASGKLYYSPISNSPLFQEDFIFLAFWNHTRLYDSFGQWNMITNDICHFHIKALRTDVCFINFLLIPHHCCIRQHSR